MPNTTIETRTGWIADASAVIEAVQSALRVALHLPEWDRTLHPERYRPRDSADATASPAR